MPELVAFLRSKFIHQPTIGQAKFLSSFSSFVLNNEKDRRAFILKGYAGTGKTTLVQTLVTSLPSFNIKCMLMAPTGRAAKVLANYTGKRAFTIHKLIYTYKQDPASGAYLMKLQKNNAKNTLYVIDEASMLSDAQGGNRDLMDDLFTYIFTDKSNMALLLGDSAQLPPVGKQESPGLDINKLTYTYELDTMCMELDEVVRQEQGSGILNNATQLRSGIAQQNFDPKFNTKQYPDIFKMTPDRFEDGIRYAYDKFGLENTTIICPANWQAVQYNQYIRRNILYYDEEIVPGDVLMVVKNNYSWLEPDSEAGFIANGDFCEVRKVRNDEEMYGHRFIDIEIQLVDYPELPPVEVKAILDTLHSNKPALDADENLQLYNKIAAELGGLSKVELKQELQTNPYLNALQIKFAYALTCHKAQGGQWQCAFVDGGKQMAEEMNKEKMRWLYTAVTRASQELYLVNFPTTMFY